MGCRVKMLLAIVLFLISVETRAQDRFGLGVSLGNPTGLNGKRWLTSTTAIDGGLAWSIGEHGNFNIHSDYLLHEKGKLLFNETYPLDLYYGIGGRMEFADDLELGVRVPVGLAHEFKKPSIDVFGEVAPIIDFLGRTGLELGLLIGSRYYF